MAIQCPYCKNGFQLKGVKPGQYKPKCPKCDRRFGLLIPTDASQPPQTAALPEEAPRAVPAPELVGAATVAQTVARGNVDATLAAPSIAATLPPTSPSAANLEATLPPSPPEDPNATAPARASEFTAVARAEQATQAMPGRSAASGGGPIPQEIGGYKILKELGRGAMGAVYLAKQVSLDRDVALKVIQAQWANDPTFVARFTREAYAAAQLNHHNMIQIYDLGAAGDVNYFSMEYVRGQTLSELIEKAGKLDPDVAIGYVLQAARGLEFAHNHGMVHRDVKPANLMVNENGIVKVADLGLVKTPQMDAPEAGPVGARGGSGPEAGSAKKTLAAATADVTMANVAMGTPAYMAPEQAENAAGVDHRADIYSLGCTLYVLLTGRPPFEGASALEVITKHRSEPVVRPDVLVKRIPKELADITLKMVAKRPEERYANLREVVRDLEHYLGISAAGPFSPSEEQVQILEQASTDFQSAPLAKLRLPIVAAFFGVAALVMLLSLVLGWVGLAGTALGLCVITAGAYFVYSGWIERTYLFDKFRELVALARWSDWLTWGAGGLVLVTLLLVFGQLFAWLGVAFVAVAAALGYYYLVDRRLTAQRAEPLRKLQELLRRLRLKGIEEASLHQFVAKYSGDHWEELFEALFGYEAKLQAREQFGRGEQGRRRNRFRAWREPLVRWLNDRIRLVKEAKARKHLTQVEEKNLTAQGLQPMQARRQAQRMADALVEDAAAVVAEKKAEAQPVDPGELVRIKRERAKQLLADARAGVEAKRRTERGGMFAPLAFLLGPKVRFLLGCLLLVGFGLWAREHAAVKVDADALRNLTTDSGLTGVQDAVKFDASKTGTRPLALPLVGGLFDSFNPGIAGVSLIFLGMFRGWKMSLYALPAAAIIVLGPSFGIPDFGIPGGKYYLCAAVGLAIAALGFLYGQTFENNWRVE